MLKNKIDRCIRLIDSLIGNDLEPKQRRYVENCRKRLIALSRKKHLRRNEIKLCVERISTQLLEAFHNDRRKPRV